MPSVSLSAKEVKQPACACDPKAAASRGNAIDSRLRGSAFSSRLSQHTTIRRRCPIGPRYECCSPCPEWSTQGFDMHQVRTEQLELGIARWMGAPSRDAVDGKEAVKRRIAELI